MSDAELGYTREEILSYLPMGWAVDERRPPAWSAERRRWTARLVDLADQTWELEVSPGEAEELGRGEALRHALRRLLRKALGRASVFG